MDLSTLLSNDPADRLTVLLGLVVVMFTLAGASIVVARLFIRRRERTSTEVGHDDTWSAEWAADMRASENTEHRVLGDARTPPAAEPAEPQAASQTPAPTGDAVTPAEAPRTTAEALLRRLRSSDNSSHPVGATETADPAAPAAQAVDAEGAPAPTPTESPFVAAEWATPVGDGDESADEEWLAEVLGKPAGR